MVSYSTCLSILHTTFCTMVITTTQGRVSNIQVIILGQLLGQVYYLGSTQLLHQRENILSRFLSNFEAFASELLENLDSILCIVIYVVGLNNQPSVSNGLIQANNYYCLGTLRRAYKVMVPNIYPYHYFSIFM